MKTISQTMGHKVYVIGPSATERRRSAVPRRRFSNPPAIAISASPAPNVVTAVFPSTTTETITTGPMETIERVPAGLSRDRESRGDRVCDDPRRDRSEEERLQSPHATLPSPPTTVSATA